jgi:hypothetical protein
MPKIISEDTLIGDVLHQWTVQEYEPHDRGSSWYAIMGTIAGLLVLFGMFTGNFLFALVVVLASIILFVQGKQDPLKVSFAITALGVIVGNRFYPYSELYSFYIIYNPPEVKMLYVETKGLTRPLLRIPLGENNPIEVRSTMRKYLEEDIDQEEEPTGDTLARRWRIH